MCVCSLNNKTQVEEEAAETARALGEARVALENTRELLKEKDARVSEG